ncbi:hypothetical protein A5724_13435 [Mycobacterium sp. ACS1612]|uniref:hypothetical protein n=1 Tax=Mycobacterium sp. ACS1612 TaxID=1834117 RepID=UPI0008016661|nr:hypothetical protein [Mycobacterium sp. ACS1612]OBF36204.1 hypothetical protein A5724_13435 [Mycobacterium sp. ACS1612]
MTHTVLYCYVIGWAVTSIGLPLTAQGRAGRVGMVVAAGAVWPLLALGAAQFATVALIAEVARVGKRNRKSLDDEFEELLAEWATSAEQAQDRRFVATTRGDNPRESTAGR